MNTADQRDAGLEACVATQSLLAPSRTVAVPVASQRQRGAAAMFATLAVGAGLALFASAGPARADLVRQLLGVNPFSSESSSGLREGVFVDAEGEEISCPRADVLENGGNVRRGEGAGLSYQLTIGTIARECVRGPDGRAQINVGVDIRALLGPAGRPGRFTSPVTIQLRRGDAVLSRVTRQIAIGIPAGEGNAMGTLVERGINLPEDTQGLLIEVGFGGAPAKARQRAR